MPKSFLGLLSDGRSTGEIGQGIVINTAKIILAAPFRFYTCTIFYLSHANKSCECNKDLVCKNVQLHFQEKFTISTESDLKQALVKPMALEATDSI